MTKKQFLIGVFDYIVITIGVILFVMAWQSFLLPNNMIDGGLTGASALLAMVTGISVDIWYFGINVLLLGIDDGDSEADESEPKRTDAMIVASFDPEAHKIWGSSPSSERNSFPEFYRH